MKVSHATSNCLHSCRYYDTLLATRFMAYLIASIAKTECSLLDHLLIERFFNGMFSICEPFDKIYTDKRVARSVCSGRASFLLCVYWLLLVNERTGRSAQVLSRQQSDEVLVGVDSARHAHWIHIYMGDSNADLTSNRL